MSNMPSLKEKFWPGRKEGQASHDKGRHTEQFVQARTAKQIEQATPVLRDWYAFIEASRKRVP
jgi:hypothetical protein